MGEENKETQTRIFITDRDKLNELSSKYGMKVSVIISVMLKTALKYNIFLEGWEDQLTEKRIQEYLKDADLEFRKKVELLNIKAQIDAKKMVFREWLDILEPREKKQFLENVMGHTKGGDFLERLANYQMFLIDGQKKLFPPDSDGYPLIPWIEKGEIIKCSRGFHIQNNRCDCRLWRECQLGSAQYESWLAQYGSDLDRRRYLEETTGQHLMVRRGS